MRDGTSRRPVRRVTVSRPAVRYDRLGARLAGAADRLVAAVADGWYRLAAALSARPLAVTLAWLGGLVAALLLRRL